MKERGDLGIESPQTEVRGDKTKGTRHRGQTQVQKRKGTDESELEGIK